MELLILTNNTYPEEKALSAHGKIILQGDEYHDKISAQIIGFIACLDHMGIEYYKHENRMGADVPLFKQIGFYNAKDRSE